jgi:hypothetical protein
MFAPTVIFPLHHHPLTIPVVKNACSPTVVSPPSFSFIGMLPKCFLSCKKNRLEIPDRISFFLAPSFFSPNSSTVS